MTFCRFAALLYCLTDTDSQKKQGEKPKMNSRTFSAGCHVMKTQPTKKNEQNQ